MTYFPSLHDYLHHSSLLIQAYPSSRITTKYSLPRKQPPAPTPSTEPQQNQNQQHRNGKREPSATLTLKTYHAESGICLKYRTDKAAEVGRLMAGLGRLARGEVIEVPSEDDRANVNVNGTSVGLGQGQTLSAGQGERMDVDSDVSRDVPAAVTVSQMTQGGGKKKKKNKK